MNYEDIITGTHLEQTCDVVTIPWIRNSMAKTLFKAFGEKNTVYIEPFLDYVAYDYGMAAKEFRRKLNDWVRKNDRIKLWYICIQTRRFFIKTFREVESVMDKVSSNQERNMK